MVIITDKGKNVMVKVGSVKLSKQELIIGLDFKETEEFKKKEVNIKNEKFIVLM